MKWTKVHRDRICFFIGFLTAEIYWPKFLNNNTDIGIFAPSQLSYKKRNEHNLWMFTRAFVLKLLGFGFGFAWKHIDNPSVADDEGAAYYD